MKLQISKNFQISLEQDILSATSVIVLTQIKHLGTLKVTKPALGNFRDFRPENKSGKLSTTSDRNMTNSGFFFSLQNKKYRGKQLVILVHLLENAIGVGDGPGFFCISLLLC